ncbi:MAG: ATP-dependent Clp protease proteolytic subunit, partial [Chloroflexota bacterium]
ILADATGQPMERIVQDTDRDIYMTADEAKAYGLVDELLSKPEAK